MLIPQIEEDTAQMVAWAQAREVAAHERCQQKESIALGKLGAEQEQERVAYGSATVAVDRAARQRKAAQAEFESAQASYNAAKQAFEKSQAAEHSAREGTWDSMDSYAKSSEQATVASEAF